ncbi:MAG: HupE/UreJ family protein [Deltaproteobacteria bacterium]|nr:HupE/UreJ family protein [Deltaproteobacteria bacterium]
MLPLVAPALAHQPGLSAARIDTSHVSLVFAKPEIGQLAPVEDVNAGRLLIQEATLDRVSLAAGGSPCRFDAPVVREVEADGVEILARYSCDAYSDTLTFTADYFDTLAPGHRQYLEVGGQPVAMLSADAPSATFAAAPSTGEVAVEFVKLGVEHIVTGYDHLAFVAGLLLAARSLRQMLVIVTGFTVAHSITLSLAATGVFTLSPGIVEPLIAASIAYVGIENYFDPGVRQRVAVTFGLGLVHGFGFAGLLAELGLPRDNLVVALVCFNGGVELGQAAVVALALPVLLRLGKLAAWPRVMRVLSALVALAGTYWLLERTLLG